MGFEMRTLGRHQRSRTTDPKGSHWPNNGGLEVGGYSYSKQALTETCRDSLLLDPFIEVD